MIKSQERAGRERAIRLDAADPLAAFRERFVFGGDGAGRGDIYLDGNSLGRLPMATVSRLERVIAAEWGEGLISSGSEAGWIDLPVTVGDRLGAVALAARRGRTEILTDADNFPTDRHVLEGLAHARGLELRWLRGDPAAGPTLSEVSALIGSRTALVSFLPRLLPVAAYRRDGRDQRAGARRRRPDAGISAPRRLGVCRPRRRLLRPRRGLHLQIPVRRPRRPRLHVLASASRR